MTSDDKRLRQLEQDFNHGDPIDMMTYKNLIDGIAIMGFSVADGLEAALVCDTKDNLEDVTNYLLESDKTKKDRYEKRKKAMIKEVVVPPEKQKLIDEMNRYVREVCNKFVLNFDGKKKGQKKECFFVFDLEQEKQKQMQLEQELRERQAVTKMQKYVEYLRGITADERVTEEEFGQLMKYREKNSIGEDEHRDALQKLDLSPQEMIEMKSNDQDDNSGRLCVNCQKENKVMCVFPCMHVCLCEKCTPEIEANSKSGGPGSGCPVCGGDIEKIVRVWND